MWQLIFLDQLGANGTDPRIQAACAYVLDHTLVESAGFGASGVLGDKRPAPSRVIHCLNGNLLHALIGFGWLVDPRVQRAVEWAAHAITGEPPVGYYASGTSGPLFACGANGGRPCAWGAIKEVLALARVPIDMRTLLVRRALQTGAEFLLSRDAAIADYPTADGTGLSALWFRLGFPSGYVSDVLQNLEALCELGFGHDRRLQHALGWLRGKQDAHGRWMNENAYNGRTWVDFDRPGTPSKWVTLRACRVLKMAFSSTAP